MRLTKSADFALRIITHLAQVQKPCTMKDLSTDLHITYNNLSKIVQKLNKAHIIRTIQGKYGGVELVSDGANISLKRIIHSIDGPTQLTECLTEKGSCGLSSACKMKGTLGRLQTQIDALFEDVKIADLVKV